MWSIGSTTAFKGREMKFRKGARVVNVNIWDDYKQKPQYDVNDPTTIRVESNDDRTDAEADKLRRIILERCHEWKLRNFKTAKSVLFELDHDDKAVIIVYELDEPNRNSLYSYLSQDMSGFGDIAIRWLMES